MDLRGQGRAEVILKKFVEKSLSVLDQLQKLPRKFPPNIEEQIPNKEKINELLQKVLVKPSFDNEYRACDCDIPEAHVIPSAEDLGKILKMFEVSATKSFVSLKTW